MTISITKRETGCTVSPSLMAGGTSYIHGKPLITYGAQEPQGTQLRKP